MKRTIIKINEALCNGCGLCVKGCHEGALRLIDGKATLISELYCDGLGACIGDCPRGAITQEEREAEKYDEKAVIKRLIPKGEEVIKAHLQHLSDHKQVEFLREAYEELRQQGIHDIPIRPVSSSPTFSCPGSKTRSFVPGTSSTVAEKEVEKGELRQWPIQLHLLPPAAPFFQDADLLVAADCTAYALGNFHNLFLKEKRLAIACPKLDEKNGIYTDKIKAIIDQGGISTLTVMIMEVPCCSGLLRVCEAAREKAERKIPLKLIRVGIHGEIRETRWL